LNPLVSVIIPAYNRSWLTVKTVESVLNQTYRPIEIIVVDDGSTDDTREQLSRYADKIQYVYKENGGACSARNAGLRLAKGTYVGFLDCDDLYHPEKVGHSIRYLEERPQMGFVHTAADFIDEGGAVVGGYDHPKSRQQGWITRRFILGNHICNSTPLIRRLCLEKVGAFDETIFTPADWDLWLRLSAVYQVGYIPRRLTQYRVSQSYVFKNLELAQREEKQVLEKFFDSHPHLQDLRKLAWANMHLRYAQCYLLKDDLLKVKEEFSLCLKYFPFHLKAWLFLGYFFVARRNLQECLRKKILGFPGGCHSRTKLCQSA